ncbi:MAG: anaphase-promoting complex subunit cdc27, partial [Watsoniomyces obsoletus]
MGLCDAGAKISVPNIYKASPEMVAMAQAAHAQSQRVENAPQHPPDNTSKSSLPLQAQATNHINQNSADPFATNTKSGHGSTVLWEKLNGSKVSVNTVSTILDEESLNTPSAVVDGDHSVLHGGLVSQVYEPPPAPIRKARSANEIPPEPPSRFKAGSTRARLRAKGGSEEAPILPDPAPPAAPSKRTISGQLANSSQLNGLEGTRRSNRLLNGNRPPSASGTTSSKLSSFTNTLGLREGREIKKTRPPISKGRTANTSTVGRVISGNRTRTGSTDTMELDARLQREISHKAVEPPINRDFEAL